ncbi:MAG TPA: branched-chain amino acid ABC transporter permease [Acidocella sp.]|jgi:branched-chain amino acid transport system permease protein|uniref:branched-chain amino acid ABC transporter permease n=1 Tax=Acidocella sp. TaxID=50710 RepID=UPI002BF1400F|nr:branched-chain amino acid ABC transporter permease [Acidocella sp.]HVE21914.1 branched-chain amino acid ABC transporter permease [Acidocella sp.]
MNFGFTKAQSIGLMLMVLAIILAPFFFYPIVVMQVMCYAVFAMGANLLMGSLGLLSLGQAAYFGLGGYITGYLVQSLGLTPELGIIAAALGAGALGTLFGWLVIRRQTIYFAMITLALAEIVYFFAVQATRFTGGENGIQGIPRGALFGVLPLANDRAMYALVAVIFLACFLFVHRIMHSPFGQVVKAIRENEPRAISLGYKVEQYKWVAFILAAMLAGIAGGTKAMVMGIETLSDVGSAASGLVVLMVLLGGIGTIFGPLIGALIVVAMQYYLAPFGAWVIVIQGVIFVACVLVFRRGVIGELAVRLKTAL